MLLSVLHSAVRFVWFLISSLASTLYEATLKTYCDKALFVCQANLSRSLEIRVVQKMEKHRASWDQERVKLLLHLLAFDDIFSICLLLSQHSKC